MNIKDAIIHSREVAAACEGECASEHLQLANWLSELVSLRNENEILKKALGATDIFLNATIKLSKENWEPALRARIEELTAENRQLDEAYKKARVILDKENAKLRAKNARLEKEADWLANELSKFCGMATRDCTYQSCTDCPVDGKCYSMRAIKWREAARQAMPDKR